MPVQIIVTKGGHFRCGHLKRMTSPRPARKHSVTVVKRRTVTSAAAFTVILVTEYLVASKLLLFAFTSTSANFVHICLFRCQKWDPVLSLVLYVYQFQQERSLLFCAHNSLPLVLIRCTCLSVILEPNSQNC